MNRSVLLGNLLLILSCFPASTQTNTFCQANGQATVHAGKLVCLLPNLGFPPVTSGADPIGGLDAAIASQASLFPLASPASGIVYTTDPSLQITAPSGTDSFGPVMFERGEILHRLSASTLSKFGQEERAWHYDGTCHSDPVQRSYGRSDLDITPYAPAGPFPAYFTLAELAEYRQQQCECTSTGTITTFSFPPYSRSNPPYTRELAG